MVDNPIIVPSSREIEAYARYSVLGMEGILYSEDNNAMVVAGIAISPCRPHTTANFHLS